jgi:hypothetical protein
LARDLREFAVKRLDIRKKFGFSLAAFAVLAVLSWLTLSNDPMWIHDTTLGIEFNIRFRTATLMVLGLLAFVTTMAFLRARIEERRETASHQ